MKDPFNLVNAVKDSLVMINHLEDLVKLRMLERFIIF